MNKEEGKWNFTLISSCVLPGIKFATKWLIYKTIGDCIHNLQSPYSHLKKIHAFLLYCVILGKWVRCKTFYVKKKMVGSAILIPSAPPQNVVHSAHCSVCSRRVFRTTPFVRTCSAHPEHTKEIHPIFRHCTNIVYVSNRKQPPPQKKE